MATNYDYLTSIHGRRIGLDKDDNIVGPVGFRERVTTATSATTGTNIPNSGFATVVTTTNDTWKLDAPVKGVSMRLSCLSSDAAAIATVSMQNATATSTRGTAGSTITFTGGGGFVELMGLSSAAWAISSVGPTSASANVSS